MKADRMWAYCPSCKHTQRFQRVEMSHVAHAVFTVLTMGLWAVSWLALIIGHRLKPWRCKQCEGSAHGTPRVRREPSESESNKAPTTG